MRLSEYVDRASCGSVALAFAIGLACTTTYSASSAAASPATCTTPVLLVHDLAGSEAEWDGWLDELTGPGRCAYAFTYGKSAMSVRLQDPMERAGLEPIAGLTRIEDSAVEFGAFVDSVRRQTGAERVQVVAHGAGGLVAQHWIAHSGSRSVQTLVTVGPLWNGTDIAGLGTVAAFNRSIGIYDELATLEQPLLEPICAACGQIVANSGYMHDAAHDGWTTPGVRYVNVISLFDGLMTDPLAAALPGSDNRILQNVDADDRTNHLELVHNPIVARLVLASLAAG